MQQTLIIIECIILKIQNNDRFPTTKKWMYFDVYTCLKLSSIYANQVLS
mgnify:CR=1 FL=1